MKAVCLNALLLLGLGPLAVGQTNPSWFPKPPPLPAPSGEVIRVSTPNELFAAVARLPQGGTILLADGRYALNQPVVLDQKQDIVLRSVSGDAAKVTLSGKGWEQGDEFDDILRIARCDGVTIANLGFADCRSYGIKIEAEHAPKNIHILGCRFQDIGVRAIKGSAAQDSDLCAKNGTVRGCYFENTRVPPAKWLFGGDYISAIDMMALENWTFSDNVFLNIKGRNGGARAAIFIWVRSRKVVVERNLIVNCDRGISFGNPGKSTANRPGESVVYLDEGAIRNNFIVGGPDCGIELWYAKGIKVLNNSIWRPKENWNRGIRIGTGTAGSEVANNLVHGGIQLEGGEAKVHHNLSGHLDGYFERPDSGDLRLTSAATGALQQGVPLAQITEDIRRLPRIGNPDLGAWQASAGQTILGLPPLGSGELKVPTEAKAILSNQDAETAAVRVEDFLNSLGVNSAVSRRGENLGRTIEAANHLGLRWFRVGYESRIPVDDLIELHNQAGVRFSYGLMSGGTNIARLLSAAKELATAGALLALEGNNEPNNWGVTYRGERGGRTNSWAAVARLQKDLYRAVKDDPMLKEFPVWNVSEGGAQTDDVGLQFLTIPTGAGTLMPEGTAFADFANCHNYITHTSWPGLHDNQTWIAADPTSACKVDGLYGNYGRTWRRHFPGYSETDLLTLPRVTTETGVTLTESISEPVQAQLYLSVYLDQFKRGWKHTAIYLLRDRTDERGNQTFGFYKPDYTPRLAATYLHNLTMVLADRPSDTKPGTLRYSIPNQPATVHDLLMQKSGGPFELVLWGERFAGGSDEVLVNLGKSFSSVTLFDPTVSVSPIDKLSDASSVSLVLSNHPMVIEIR